MPDSQQLRGATVLVLGDVMLDEYLWGSAERISPEAPVPVVDVERRTRVPGGAANAAAGIAALESTAILAGLIGDDDAGEGLRASMAAIPGLRIDGLIRDPSRPTTTKTRVIANAQQVVRTDNEDRSPPGAGVAAELAATVARLTAGADAMLISDYGKGVVAEEVVRPAIDAAIAAGVPVVVDSKGRDYVRFRGATILTPNIHDLGRAANVRIETDDDLAEAARRIEAVCDAGLLVTRGARGMSYFGPDGQDPVHIATEAREVFDVTGAGDTVVAVLSTALARGFDPVDAIRLANRAAGIVVGKVGTSVVTLAELGATENGPEANAGGDLR